MVMLPFGQTILLWRAHRGLTQRELSQRVGMPRPNLCAIERGRREVTLVTLRALAAALDVRPGLLADGVPPAPEGGEPSPLSREALERIADAVAFDRPVRAAGEQAMVDALRMLLENRRLAARGRRGRPRTGRRRMLAAWGRLKSLRGGAAIQTLADRVLERQGAHDPANH